jgi:streptogramin lyase
MGAASYAITVGTDDRIYYGFNARNFIAVFDPANPMQEQQVIPIPIQGTATNRHMTTDVAKRRVWLGLSGVRSMAYIQLP